jgi:NAD(P)-dependent dehydrogenase (short-subunit alcohol dehydrogenase family)
VLDCGDKDWDFSFDLNVKSMHRTIKAFLPGMLAKGHGSIVNIASGAGSVRGIPNRYVYGASKAAVIGLTKAVAADFIKKGIRANAIAPATVRTVVLPDDLASRPLLSMLPRGLAATSWVTTDEDGVESGLVGWGEAARGEFAGPERFSRAPRWWGVAPRPSPFGSARLRCLW